MVPDQTTTRWSSPDPVSVTVNFVGRETVTVPIGPVDSYRLRVEGPSGSGLRYDLWFAAKSDPSTADEPGLHVLVRLDGPREHRLELESVERRAYWQ